MANPVFVDCPAGVWTKVATNITTGQIHKVDVTPQEYLHTYKQTGDAAPTDRSEGVRIFIGANISEIISHNTGIDIYIFPVLSAGRIRVDL